MRVSYLGQDRADIQEASQMLGAKGEGFCRVGRYLNNCPGAVPEQSWPKDLEAWVDVAGDVFTKRSTSRDAVREASQQHLQYRPGTHQTRAS